MNSYKRSFLSMVLLGSYCFNHASVANTYSLSELPLFDISGFWQLVYDSLNCISPDDEQSDVKDDEDSVNRKSGL